MVLLCCFTNHILRQRLAIDWNKVWYKAYAHTLEHVRPILTANIPFSAKFSMILATDALIHTIHFSISLVSVNFSFFILLLVVMSLLLFIFLPLCCVFLSLDMVCNKSQAFCFVCIYELTLILSICVCMGMKR